MLLALLFTTLAHAQLMEDYSPHVFTYEEASERVNCSDVDLRQEMRQRSLPLERQQGPSGWCYAFVLADLLSFEASENFSPADIAREYFRAHPDRFGPGRPGLAMSFPLGGGFMHQAFEDVRTQGVCRETDFPSEDYHAPPRPVILPGQPKPPVPQVDLDVAALAVHFPHQGLAQMLEQIRTPEFRRVLQALQGRECRKGAVAQQGEYLYRTKVADTQLNAPMDAWLTQEAPVGLSLDSGFLYGQPTRGMMRSPSITHAVVLAGRRFNAEAQRCEYLIRNSEVECDSYPNASECQDNHAWIPRQIVRASVGSIFRVR